MFYRHKASEHFNVLIKYSLRTVSRELSTRLQKTVQNSRSMAQVVKREKDGKQATQCGGAVLKKRLRLERRGEPSSAERSVSVTRTASGRYRERRDGALSTKLVWADAGLASKRESLEASCIGHTELGSGRSKPCV